MKNKLLYLKQINFQFWKNIRLVNVLSIAGFLVLSCHYQLSAQNKDDVKESPRPSKTIVEEDEKLAEDHAVGEVVPMDAPVATAEAVGRVVKRNIPLARAKAVGRVARKAALAKANAVGKVKKKRSLPPWAWAAPPVLGGTAFLLLNDKGENQPPPPEARDDNFTLPCGRAFTLDVLRNDMGSGIKIIDWIAPMGVTVMIRPDGLLSVELQGGPAFTFTYTIQDAQGRTSTATVFLTVLDDVAPDLICPPDATIFCGEDPGPGNTGEAEATDNCDPSPEMDFSDLREEPDVIFIHEELQRTWKVEDDNGNSSECTQTITIEDRTAPEITCPDELTLECGSDENDSTITAWLDLAQATDNCVLKSLTNNYDAGSFSTACGQTGEQTVTFIAADRWNESTCTNTIRIEDTTPPEINPGARDREVQCDGAGNVQAYNQWLDDQGGAAAEDACGSVSWSHNAPPPGSVTLGDIEVTFTASDECGNNAGTTAVFSIIDELPPTITCPADVTISCQDDSGPENTGFAQTSDPCDATPELTYSDETIAGSCAQEKQILRSWMATDLSGNSAVCVQIITIQDKEAPTISCPQDVTLACDTPTTPEIAGFATAEDNCDPNVVITYEDSDPVFEGCVQRFSFTRTWTATDACNNSNICEQLIHVTDQKPPQLTCPENIILLCSTLGPGDTDPSKTGFPEVSDNCDPNPDIQYSDIFIVDDITGTVNIIRTWEVTDACGNSSNCSQAITLPADLDEPFFTDCPSDTVITLASGGCQQVVNYTVEASDNCGIQSLMQIDNSGLSPGSAFPIGEWTQTWEACDSSGNCSICEFTITIEEFPDPIPILDCKDEVTTVLLDNEECEKQVGAGILLEGGPYGCFDDYFVFRANGTDIVNADNIGQTVRFRVDDPESGSFCTADVLVIDPIPPIAANPPQDTLVLECGAEVPPFDPMFIDYCSDVEVEMSSVTFPDTCGGFRLERSWEAYDESFNITIVDQTVIVDCGCANDPLNAPSLSEYQGKGIPSVSLSAVVNPFLQDPMPNPSFDPDNFLPEDFWKDWSPPQEFELVETQFVLPAPGAGISFGGRFNTSLSWQLGIQGAGATGYYRYQGNYSGPSGSLLIELHTRTRHYGFDPSLRYSFGPGQKFFATTGFQLGYLQTTVKYAYINSNRFPLSGQQQSWFGGPFSGIGLQLSISDQIVLEAIPLLHSKFVLGRELRAGPFSPSLHIQLICTLFELRMQN